MENSEDADEPIIVDNSPPTRDPSPARADYREWKVVDGVLTLVTDFSPPAGPATNQQEPPCTSPATA